MCAVRVWLRDWTIGQPLLPCTNFCSVLLSPQGKNNKLAQRVRWYQLSSWAEICEVFTLLHHSNTLVMQFLEARALVFLPCMCSRHILQNTKQLPNPVKICEVFTLLHHSNTLVMQFLEARALVFLPCMCSRHILQNAKQLLNPKWLWNSVITHQGCETEWLKFQAGLPSILGPYLPNPWSTKIWIHLEIYAL